MIQANVRYVPGVGGGRPTVAIQFSAVPDKAPDVVVTDLSNNSNVAVTAGTTTEDFNADTIFHYDTDDISGLDLETVGQKQLLVHFVAEISAVETIESVVLTVVPDEVIPSLYDGAINVASFGVAAAVRGVNGTRNNPTRAANGRALDDLLGYRKFRFLDNEALVLTAVAWDGCRFESDGNSFGSIDVNLGTGFDGADFRNVFVFGVFPAGTDTVDFSDATLLNPTLPFATGAIRCALAGRMKWSGGLGVFRDCFDATAPLGGSPFILDMDDKGATAPIEFRRYAGAMKVENMTVAVTLDINLNGGTITIDASCTAGSVKVYGTGKVINNSALVIDTSELINPDDVIVTRKIADNRMEIDFTAQELVLYDDDGTTKFRQWPVETNGVENVATVVGVQTKRKVSTI